MPPVGLAPSGGSSFRALECALAVASDDPTRAAIRKELLHLIA